MLKRASVVAAVGVLSASGLAVATAVQSGTDSPGGHNPGATTISWATCPDTTDLRCADLDVPADWHHPDGERVSVRLAMLPARDPAHRVGPLLVNLGADGATADSLPAERERLAELTEWFDVVTFDARGRGSSSGVRCDPAPKAVTTMFSLDERTWDEFARANRAWEATCREAAGPLAGTMDSWQVAHDMEAIRGALGTGGLSYYGNSYGTVFGKAYAELFPTNVNRMYLDSVSDHTSQPLGNLGPMAALVRDEFERFGRWCTTDPACALHPADGRDVWDGVLAESRRNPLPAPGAGPGATVGPEQVRFAAFTSVPLAKRWPAFAQKLAAARDGDATGLHITPADIPSGIAADALAWCADFPFTGDWAGMTATEDALREVDPRAGWLMAKMYYGRCGGMSHQGTFPPHPIAPEGLPPVLLVSGLRDTTTPPAGATALAAQLPGSVWVGADADHAVYLDGNRCVRDIAHDYLRTGRLPQPGRTCPAG